MQAIKKAEQGTNLCRDINAYQAPQDEYITVLLTAEEMAQYWGVHEKTIRRWGNKGKIKTVKGDRAVRYPLEYRRAK